MKKPAFFKTKKGKILLGILIVLIALRIALPYIVLHYANKTLANMKGYYGHVNDIDIALYRGAYVLDSFYLNKVAENSDRQTAFISARAIDLSIEWKAIFKGKIVGELIFERPSLLFTKDKVELDDVAKDTSDFRELLNNFMPVKVNRCEIQDGQLRYVDKAASPKLDLGITHINATALNLRNAYASNELLPATVEASGDVYEGTLGFSMKLNPLADQPTFDLNSTAEHINLVKLNDFFRAYGGFDVNKGEFGMYAEAATKDRKFTGYVKPIIQGLDVVDWQGQDKKDNFFHKVWESIVGGAGELFENQRKDQLATKINFRGNLDDPKVNIFQVIVIVLQNAFIQALRPSIDNQINLSKLAKDDSEKKKGPLEKLFSSDKKKTKKEKKRKKD